MTHEMLEIAALDDAQLEEVAGGGLFSYSPKKVDNRNYGIVKSTIGDNNTIVIGNGNTFG